MAVTDPVADFLTRIRNATHAKHKKVDIPASKMKIEIARILLENNFIQHYTVLEEGSKKNIRIYLKYFGGENILKGLQRISKPGIRTYSKNTELPRVLNGLGIAIVSTSKGIMTEKQARQLKVGGEILCYIW
jgi:small subunit ribosomal protein S8